MSKFIYPITGLNIQIVHYKAHVFVIGT